MKTKYLIAGAAMGMVLCVSSCRQPDDSTEDTTVKPLIEIPATTVEEPKDPPKDVPKDRDNWRSPGHQKQGK